MDIGAHLSVFLLELFMVTPEEMLVAKYLHAIFGILMQSTGCQVFASWCLFLIEIYPPNTDISSIQFNTNACEFLVYHQ